MENSLDKKPNKYWTLKRREHVRAAAKRLPAEGILFILMLGLSFVIVYPFLIKLLASFMSRADLYDPGVALIPREWSLSNYAAILGRAEFWPAAGNTFFYAAATAVLTVFCSSLVGYGLTKFRFPGAKLLLVLVGATLFLPSQTIYLPLYSFFRYFDFFGVLEAVTGSAARLTNTPWPLLILSATGLGFRGGVFIVLMRQYYKGVPDELLEAARVDGAGPYRTFFQIVFPMAKSMLVVVASLSFAWQWTDTFYSGILMGDVRLLPNLVLQYMSTSMQDTQMYYHYVLANTGVLLAVAPLLLVYIFLQKQIVEGIERSGIVG